MPEWDFAAYCEPGSRRDGRGSVMSHQAAALGWAEARVMAVRDNPAARLALMLRLLFEERDVWRHTEMPIAARILERATRAR